MHSNTRSSGSDVRHRPLATFSDLCISLALLACMLRLCLWTMCSCLVILADAPPLFVAPQTEALYRKDQSRLWFLRRVRRFNLDTRLGHIVVASVIFFFLAAAFWGGIIGNGGIIVRKAAPWWGRSWAVRR